MDRNTSRVARRLSPLLVGILLLTILGPAGARAASTDLTLGGQATVSGADGGFALLRSEPGWDSMVLTSVPEGTVVDILDGPFTADDGSLWYGVIALDQQGVLPAALLIPGAGITEETATSDSDEASEGESATDVEVAAPVPTGEIATIAGTSDEGARCRTEPTYEAEVIIVLYEGEAVELTALASEEWQPLICAGVQGFVHNDFVLLEGESPLEPAPAEEVPAEEVPVVEEAPVEEAPVAEVPAEEVPVEEVPAEEIPVTEAPVVEQPVDQIPTEDIPVEDVPAEEVPAEEAPVFEAPAEEPEVIEPEPTDVIAPPVEEPTETPTEVPTEEPTAAPTEAVETPVATEEPAETETPVATEEPTEVPTEVVEPTPVPTVAVPEIAADEAVAIQQTFSAAVDTSASSATGYAVVTGTNGEGVRCRAEGNTNSATITVLQEGAEVALRGEASGTWQPVVCAKSNGFVHTDYLAESNGSGDITAAVGSDGEFTAAAVSGTAVVSGTGGGGLRCRTSAGYSGSIITVMPEGSKVNLNGSAQGEWQPVICAGKSGFAHVDYLTKSASSSKSTNDSSSGGTGGTGTAKVTGTNGDGLRCRSSAGYGGSIITVLAEGATVSLRGNAQGEWTPVTCAGRNGYVHSGYITTSSGGSSSGGSTSGGSSGTAKVTGTGGGGLNCRSSANASSSVLVVLSEGATVTLRGAAQGSWQPVVCGGKNGFVHIDFISKSGGSSGGGSNSGGSNGGGSSSDGRFAIGSHVVTTSSLNLRYEPSMSAGVAAVAPSGTVVKVTGNRVGFVSVNWDGLKGWMHSDYLTPTNAALSQRGGSGTPTTPTNPGTTPNNPAPGGNGSGSAIVNFAMNYVGYPYVWAGEGPYGFDCSGFTMFVIKNVLGINITHDMFVQYDMGTPVSRNALQPGDLVFFQNTFRWGMSHTGIYIGNGQFVHAENETTGVRVSDINSQYYSSRYYGAVRYA